MKFLVKDSNKIDLHIHTKYSDGKDLPINIMRRACRDGLEYICFADHNCDLARFDFEKEELKKDYKIKIIPGCEIYAKINDKRIHLLAYNYNSLFNKMFLPKINKNAKEKKILSLKKACALIHFCGGKAVLAHPFKYKFDGKELVEEIIKLKCIDGIECIHAYHNQEEIDYLLEVCEQNNLYVTAGSDFHHKEKELRDGIAQEDIYELPLTNSTIEEQLIRAKQKYNPNKKR